MKYGRLMMLACASLSLQLAGCATTPVVKGKNNEYPPIIPSGYSERIGTVNVNPSEHRAIPVKAFSSTTDGNEANNVVDGDFDTRWSSKGTGTWVIVDYGKSIDVNAVRIAFTKGDQRSAKFNVLVSQDGASWKEVIGKGVSSGITLQYERFPFEDTKARYIKYVGQGNFNNDWSSATEINAVNCRVNRCPESELISIDTIKKVNKKRY